MNRVAVEIDDVDGERLEWKMKTVEEIGVMCCHFREIVLESAVRHAAEMASSTHLTRIDVFQLARCVLCDAVCHSVVSVSRVDHELMVPSHG